MLNLYLSVCVCVYNINQSSYFMIDRGVRRCIKESLQSTARKRRGQRLGFISNDATYPQLAPLL